MSYILGQIFLCLLAAGALGALFGWLLRGGCTKKLQEQKDEWERKVETLESDINTQFKKKSVEETIHSSSVQNNDVSLQSSATLKNELNKIDITPPANTYEEELKKKLQLSQDTDSDTSSTITKGVGAAVVAGAAALSTRGISLETEKVELYSEHGLDLHHDEHLEDAYDIHSVKEMQEYAPKLKDLGYHTTKDLAKLNNDAQATQKLSQELNVPATDIESWIGKSCLLELPGVDNQTADMLDQAGITSSTLHQSNPDEIHQKLTQHSQQALIPVKIPEKKMISVWSKIAKPTGLTGLAGTAAAASMPSLNQTTTKTDLSEKKQELYRQHGVDLESAQDIADVYDIQEIEGIEAPHAQILKADNITTTQALFDTLYNHHDKLNQLSEKLEIKPRELSSWVSKASLMQLPGVNAHYAHLMQTVGISSVAELGISNLDALHREMSHYHTKAGLSSTLPTLQMLQKWANISKELS